MTSSINKCGIRIDEKKVSLLSNRIRRRLKAGDFENFDVYYRFLNVPGRSRRAGRFLDAITTNETFFFRTENISTGSRTICCRNWSSSNVPVTGPRRYESGQRAAPAAPSPTRLPSVWPRISYRLRDWSLEMLGTDISEEALREAREGVFKPRSVRGGYRKAATTLFSTSTEDDRWQVRQEIKQLVEFKKHNLMTPLNESAFDCIFIRNVLIYFDRDSKRAVIGNLLNALGWAAILWLVLRKAFSTCWIRYKESRRCSIRKSMTRSSSRLEGVRKESNHDRQHREFGNPADDMAEYLQTFLDETEEQLDDLVETMLALEQRFQQRGGLERGFPSDSLDQRLRRDDGASTTSRY